MRVGKSVVGDDHVTRREWMALPPLQRMVRPIAPVAPREPFVAALRSHHNPSFLRPLTHAVDPAGPGGLITGLLTPLRAQSVQRQVTDGAELSFVQRLRARVLPVSRAVQSAPLNEEWQSAPAADPIPNDALATPDDDRQAPQATTDEPGAQTLGTKPSPIPAETTLPALPAVAVPASPQQEPMRPAPPAPVQRIVPDPEPPVAPLIGPARPVTLERATTVAPENRSVNAGTPAVDTGVGSVPAPSEVPVRTAGRDRPVERAPAARVQRVLDPPATGAPAVAQTESPPASRGDRTPAPPGAAAARSLPTVGTLTTAPSQPAVSRELPVVARAADDAPIDPAPSEPAPPDAEPVPDHPILPVSDQDQVLIATPAQPPPASVPNDGGDHALRPHRGTEPISATAGTPMVQRAAADERPSIRAGEPLRAVPTESQVSPPPAPVETAPAVPTGPSAAVVVEAWAAARQSALPVSRSVDVTTPAPAVQREPTFSLPADAGVSSTSPTTSSDATWATAPVITHAEPLRITPLAQSSGSVAEPAATPGQPAAPDRPVQLQAPLVLRSVVQRATDPTVREPPGEREAVGARMSSAVPTTSAGAPLRAGAGATVPSPSLPVGGSAPTAAAVGIAQRSVDRSLISPAPAIEPSTDNGPGAPQVGTVTGEAPVQREDAAQPQDAGTAQPAPAPISNVATAGPAAAPTQNLDDLVRRLYDPLAARLRAELRLDRERAGLITDLRRP